MPRGFYSNSCIPTEGQLRGRKCENAKREGERRGNRVQEERQKFHIDMNWLSILSVLSVCLHLSAYLLVVCLFYLLFWLSVNCSVFISVYFSVCLSTVYLLLFILFIHCSICLFVCLFCPSVYPCVKWKSLFLSTDYIHVFSWVAWQCTTEVVLEAILT